LLDPGGADIRRAGRARGFRCIASGADGDEVETSPAASEVAVEYQRRQTLARCAQAEHRRALEDELLVLRGVERWKGARTWDKKDLSMPNSPVLA
jgi:hypothetical protein